MSFRPVALLAAVVLVGCGSTPSTSSTASSSGSTAAGEGGAALGRTVFVGEGGCANCHTLAAAHAKGQVGPNLDSALRGKSAAFIRQSIVKPNAVIAPGYGAGSCPRTSVARSARGKCRRSSPTWCARPPLGRERAPTHRPGG